MNKRRLLPIAVLAVLLAIAAAWWWSPVVVLHLMKRAGARGDSEAIAAHVDAPALRENLRGQFGDAMTGKIGKPEDNPLSALGNLVGMGFINQLVDVMVRPQTIGTALRTGRVRPGALGAANEPVEWALQREGMDRAIFRPHRAGEPVDAKASAFVFVRHGFADWKLTEIRLQLDR